MSRLLHNLSIPEAYPAFHLASLSKIWGPPLAKDALHALESIQHITIDLGGTSLDRTSTPTAEQASILAPLKVEPALTTRSL